MITTDHEENENTAVDTKLCCEDDPLVICELQDILSTPCHTCYLWTQCSELASSLISRDSNTTFLCMLSTLAYCAKGLHFNAFIIIAIELYGSLEIFMVHHNGMVVVQSENALWHRLPTQIIVHSPLGSASPTTLYIILLCEKM